MHILDNLDHQLIAILRRDGRAPVSKLAEILSVSRATVQSRLDKLINTGAIQGFTVRFQEHQKNAVFAIMLIQVEGTSTTAVIKQLRGLPELHSLHTTNGRWDLIAEIRTETLEGFDKILRKVREIKAVLNSETNLILSTI